VATEKLGLVPPQQGQVLMVHQTGDGPGLSLPPAEQVRLARHVTTGRVSE